MATNDSGDQNKEEERNVPHRAEALFPLPFEIQLHNTFAVEITTRRFPVTIPENCPLNPNVNLSLNGLQIDEKNLQAQIVLNVHVDFPNEPCLFEISFRILGIFTYTLPYTAEMVRFYLERGSLSALLPFARELLASLCMRMQVPIFYIPMIPVAPSQPHE